MSDDYKKEFRLSLSRSSDEDKWYWPDVVHEWTIHKASDIPNFLDVERLIRETHMESDDE